MPRLFVREDFGLITKAERRIAGELLEELESGWLEVAKIPSQQGGYVRVPLSVNCEWYQAFCKRFMRPRRRYPKPRTFIKRCHTVRGLEEIKSGRAETEYARRLIEVVRER